MRATFARLLRQWLQLPLRPAPSLARAPRGPAPTWTRGRRLRPRARGGWTRASWRTAVRARVSSRSWLEVGESGGQFRHTGEFADFLLARLWQPAAGADPCRWPRAGRAHSALDPGCTAAEALSTWSSLWRIRADGSRQNLLAFRAAGHLPRAGAATGLVGSSSPCSQRRWSEWPHRMASSTSLSTASGQVHLQISPHLAKSRCISPHLATSRRISPSLARSRPTSAFRLPARRRLPHHRLRCFCTHLHPH